MMKIIQDRVKPYLQSRRNKIVPKRNMKKEVLLDIGIVFFLCITLGLNAQETAQIVRGTVSFSELGIFVLVGLGIYALLASLGLTNPENFTTKYIG